MHSRNSTEALRRLTWPAWATGAALTILGARWAIIGAYGTDVPVDDQWDAEGLHLLLPWKQGRPLWPELWSPHNEHHVVLTKLLNLGLTALNGQWDQRVQCVTNAILPTLVAIATAGWARRFLSPRCAVLTGSLVAITWAAPVGWENLINGFHSQQLLLIALSMAAVIAMIAADVGSWSWWLGLCASALALLTMGSGLLASAAVFGTTLLRFVARSTTWRHAWPTLISSASTATLGYLARVEAAHHAGLRAQSAHDFVFASLHSLQWPTLSSPLLALLVWLPFGWLAVVLLSRRTGTRQQPNGWALFGLGLWVLAQIFATAYARGAAAPAPASRYADTLLFGCTVNLLALGWLATCAFGPRVCRRVLFVVGVSWLVVVGYGLQRIATDSLTRDLPERHRENQEAAANTRAYLATGDPAHLSAGAIPYPWPHEFEKRLSHPELLALLPASVSPRNRFNTSETAMSAKPHWQGDAATTAPLSAWAGKAGRAGIQIAAVGLVVLLGATAAIWATAPPQARNRPMESPRQNFNASPTT